MSLIASLSLVFLTVIICEVHGGAGDTQPMVAFLCNKPSMYLTKAGWQRDEKTDCLQDPEEILKYCKDKYPDLEITNVVEGREPVTISDWCSFGHKKCHSHGTHTVRPVKCLVGAFQSEALLVPDHCVFDHIHEDNAKAVCQGPQEWRRVAEKACGRRAMIQQSYSILLPCKVDKFAGVEFVCCPHDSSQSVKKAGVQAIAQAGGFSNPDDVEDLLKKLVPTEQKSKEEAVTDTEDEEYEDADEEDDYWDEDDDEYYDQEYEEDENHTDEATSTEKAPVNPAENSYSKYLHRSEKDNEHNSFSKAKSEMEKQHHEKVTKMMKEWSAARQRVQEMKKTDERASEKLNREITARFQKTYAALEQEGKAESNQLSGLHQQRVQSNLNDKKRRAMEKYISTLQKQKMDATRISKALQHYIRVEQKDRQHTLNHYKHILETDPDQAARIREQTKDHLSIIEERMSQSMQMLNRVPEAAQRIKFEIQDFLRGFSEIDINAARLLQAPVQTKPPVTAAPVTTEKKQEVLTEKMRPLPVTDRDIVVKTERPMEVKSLPVDDEVSEDEHKEPEVEMASIVDIKRPAAAHARASSLLQEESGVHAQENMQSATWASSSTGAAVAGIMLVLVAAVAVVMLRRRRGTLGSRAQRLEHGFLDVQPPRERTSLQHLQSSGYENPTYKYLEAGIGRD